jgi:hypothetical protein
MRAGGMATLVATIINAILFDVGSTFTFPADAITALGGPISLPAVVISTLVSGLLATLGYVVLTRFLSVRVARIVFWVCLALVLLLSAANPFGITNVPIAEIVILEIMHLVAGLLPAWRMTFPNWR